MNFFQHLGNNETHTIAIDRTNTTEDMADWLVANDCKFSIHEDKDGKISLDIQDPNGEQFLSQVTFNPANYSAHGTLALITAFFSTVDNLVSSAYSLLNDILFDNPDYYSHPKERDFYEYRRSRIQ